MSAGQGIFVKTDMVAKGISQDDIPENWVGDGPTDYFG